MQRRRRENKQIKTRIAVSETKNRSSLSPTTKVGSLFCHSWRHQLLQINAPCNISCHKIQKAWYPRRNKTTCVKAHLGVIGMLNGSLVLSWFIFTLTLEPGSHTGDLSGVELWVILLSQTPKSWDYRCCTMVPGSDSLLMVLGLIIHSFIHSTNTSQMFTVYLGLLLRTHYS